MNCNSFDCLFHGGLEDDPPRTKCSIADLPLQRLRNSSIGERGEINGKCRMYTPQNCVPKFRMRTEHWQTYGIRIEPGMLIYTLNRPDKIYKVMQVATKDKGDSETREVESVTLEDVSSGETETLNKESYDKLETWYLATTMAKYAIAKLGHRI